MVPDGECSPNESALNPTRTPLLKLIDFYIAGTGVTSAALVLDCAVPGTFIESLPIFPQAVPTSILLCVALLHGCVALCIAQGLHRLHLWALSVGQVLYVWATGLTFSVNLMYSAGPVPTLATFLGLLTAFGIAWYVWTPTVRMHFH